MKGACVEDIEIPGTLMVTQEGGKGYWTAPAQKGRHITVEPPYESDFYGTQRRWTVSVWTADCNYIWAPFLVGDRASAADFARHLHGLVDCKITLKDLRALDPTASWDGEAQAVSFPVWLG